MSKVDAQAWAPWIAEVAEAVGVDADAPVAELMELSGRVSREFLRPMAPVSTFLWGLARATHPDADPIELADTILSCMPR